MGRKTEGWVEYSPFFEEEDIQSTYGWIGFINVGTAIQFIDDLGLLIFGDPNGNNEDLKHKPFANKRGLPSNPSYHVRDAIEENNASIQETGHRMYFGFNYIYFEEIEIIDFAKYGINNFEASDWIVLFKMIKVFKEMRKVNNTGNIRIVVWYSM